MHFSTTTILSALLASSVLATPLTGLRRRDAGDDSNSNINIFPNANKYDDWAICKGKITKGKFPQLQAPTNDGGCVRYFEGIDITGVVTMVNLYFKDGIQSACDCAAQCLDRPESCTNWVFKHTFATGLDGGKRSCTLYSSPNLPKSVTLVYDLHNSTGLGLSEGTGVIGMNPQAGCDAPLTTLDQAGTQPDKYGVSGFAVRDVSGRQYC
jgi:hypothetical protein